MRFRQHTILGSLARFALALLPGILLVTGRRVAAATATDDTAITFTGTTDAMCSYYRSSTRAVLEVCSGAAVEDDFDLQLFTPRTHLSRIPTAKQVNTYLEEQKRFINKAGMNFVDAANAGLIFLHAGAPHNASIRLTNCESSMPDKVRVGKYSTARFIQGSNCTPSRQPEVAQIGSDPQTNLMDLDLGSWEKNEPAPAMFVKR